MELPAALARAKDVRSTQTIYLGPSTNPGGHADLAWVVWRCLLAELLQKYRFPLIFMAFSQTFWGS